MAERSQPCQRGSQGSMLALPALTYRHKCPDTEAASQGGAAGALASDNHGALCGSPQHANLGSTTGRSLRLFSGWKDRKGTTQAPQAKGREARLYSRGQGADVLVAAEGQADCGEGPALVEHLCDLGGQVAGGVQEHLPQVAGPGGGLLLRPGGRQQKRDSPEMTTSHPQRQGSAPKPQEKSPSFKEKGQKPQPLSSLPSHVAAQMTEMICANRRRAGPTHSTPGSNRKSRTPRSTTSKWLLHHSPFCCCSPCARLQVTQVLPGEERALSKPGRGDGSHVRNKQQRCSPHMPIAVTHDSRHLL